ncbi:fatty-acid amide hydrolase 2-like [Parasteatoda tepidariorum]|uniref:fatty-acid amide hydrolase 2-like n=1 Tax=Parasteatoda tepidariorum TaxID=114398 RepID=UPI0039BC92D8
MNLVHRIIAGRKKALPPIDDEILFMSATELAERIRNRKLKCEDVIRSYYKRAQEVQPLINAITDARYEGALKEAIQIDQFLEKVAKTPEEIKKDTPLLGVPFSCKEVLGIEGLRQTCGIYEERNNIADSDGDAPALYRAAGAIPVTVTNVPELCYWIHPVNKIYGQTKNPYDTTRIPGGSSGGEAALIASAGAVIGIGTDMAGSIRIPSSLCGIYGHKPSSGVVSNRGYFPWIEPEEMSFDHINCTGPMCRYAEDLLLLMKVLSRNDPRLDLDKQVDFKNVKIYYMEETPNNPVLPAIKQAFKKAVTHFEERFEVKAIKLQLPEFEYSFDLFKYKVLDVDFLSKRLLADKNGKVHLWLEILKFMVGISEHCFPFLLTAILEKNEKDQIYYETMKIADSLEKKLQKIFQEEAIFLLPAAPDTAPFCHSSITKLRNMMYFPIFNHFGVPITSVPVSLHNGLPIGIQVVSGQLNDRLTIAAAVELNTVFRGWKNPCSTTARKVWSA